MSSKNIVRSVFPLEIKLLVYSLSWDETKMWINLLSKLALNLLNWLNLFSKKTLISMMSQQFKVGLNP